MRVCVVGVLTTPAAAPPRAALQCYMMFIASPGAARGDAIDASKMQAGCACLGFGYRVPRCFAALRECACVSVCVCVFECVYGRVVAYFVLPRCAPPATGVFPRANALLLRRRARCRAHARRGG